MIWIQVEKSWTRIVDFESSPYYEDFDWWHLNYDIWTSSDQSIKRWKNRERGLLTLTRRLTRRRRKRRRSKATQNGGRRCNNLSADLYDEFAAGVQIFYCLWEPFYSKVCTWLPVNFLSAVSEQIGTHIHKVNVVFLYVYFSVYVIIVNCRWTTCNRHSTLSVSRRIGDRLMNSKANLRITFWISYFDQRNKNL